MSVPRLMPMWRIAAGGSVLAAALACSACSTLASGQGWGATATARPGWERVREAAVEAAKDPWVWVPVAGALAFQINSFDRRTSDWAREHTPVFGSAENAVHWSDDLRAACGLMMIGTLIATPGGHDSGEWLLNKLKGGIVELAAVGATSVTTGMLKDTAGRTRPNGADDESFPSGHSSSAAVSCRLAKINLDSINIKSSARLATDIGIGTVVFGTAWARVEAGEHFPSDVLAGIALGNFLGRFVTGAFLDPDAHQSVSLELVEGGARLHWNSRF